MNIRIKITRDGNPDRGKIVTLDLDDYLRGVVPAEMYASDPPEAQAIAARTWAARRIKPSQPYDVDDTSACQAYRPHDRIDKRTDAAITATRGQVLRYAGKLIDAVFTDGNGGRMVSASKRWGSAVPYLVDKPDPYDNSPKVSGHGVGLSQIGAREAAKQGLSYRQILAFYYPGCAIGQLETSAAQPAKPAAGPVKFSLKAQGNALVSENFRVREFVCKDGNDMIMLDMALVVLLQAIRDHFGAAVTIVSGYRTEAYNAKCGGAKGSLHLTGQAADIKVAGVSVREVALYAQSIGAGGVGAYLPSRFVHVDCREGKKVRWIQRASGQANRYVSDLKGVL